MIRKTIKASGFEKRLYEKPQIKVHQMTPAVILEGSTENYQEENIQNLF